MNNDVTGAEAHEAFKHWDLGDIGVGDTQAVLDGDLDDFISASLKQGVQK